METLRRRFPVKSEYFLVSSSQSPMVLKINTLHVNTALSQGNKPYIEGYI